MSVRVLYRIFGRVAMTDLTVKKHTVMYIRSLCDNHTLEPN